MLLVAILADATNLFNYSCNVMRGRCQNVFWCELSNIFITVLKVRFFSQIMFNELTNSILLVFQFILAIATFCWFVEPFGTMLFCCSSKENLMRDKSSLKGTYLRYFTLSILFLCLLPAIFGSGDERIQTLTWNQRNADNTNDSQLVFNYELKPALPTSRWVLQWDEHSMDFYDISSTIDNRYYNYNETKDFLEKYHCEILIPTNEVFFQRYDIVPLFGPFGRCMRYTASIPNCSPP